MRSIIITILVTLSTLTAAMPRQQHTYTETITVVEIVADEFGDTWTE